LSRIFATTFSIAFTHRLYLLSFANLLYHVGQEGRVGALLDRSLGYKHQAELVRKIEHCCLVAEKLTVARAVDDGHLTVDVQIAQNATAITFLVRPICNAGLLASVIVLFLCTV